MSNDSRRPAVTLIVVSYNHERFLPDLLASIDAQVRAPDRVLLYDDRSSDDSAALLTRWASETSLPVEVRINPDNIGLTPTLNRALSAVDTPFYAYISGDDLMEPTRIDAQLSALAASEHAFSYSDAVVVNEDGTVVGHSFFEMFLGVGVEPSDTFEALLREGNWIPACSVMLRTSSVREVGGYDEDLFFEDYDLWLRLARVGTFTHVTSPQVRFRRVGSSLGSTKFNDADDDWQWAKIRIRAKHLGHDKDADAVIVDKIRPWLVTLAARGHPRTEIAPLLRSSFARSPGAVTLAWAALASVPAPGLLRRAAMWWRGR
ncbi:glycosyltransferase [Microbacterium sp. ARD31]|uniref:glycosyltransferase n=1 Tax=Microbacterium sp. ARD31 TaxID=2962576 RepID=UPI002881555D|nr:glycosyltransferase [Microbacterium sp. ARD31]MDT0183423.1 glycosyltransferase [Microbacterium sp. ARD31]